MKKRLIVELVLSRKKTGDSWQLKEVWKGDLSDMTDLPIEGVCGALEDHPVKFRRVKRQQKLGQLPEWTLFSAPKIGGSVVLQQWF